MDVTIDLFTTSRGIRAVFEHDSVLHVAATYPLAASAPAQLWQAREVLWKVAPRPSQLDIYFNNEGPEGFVDMLVFSHHQITSDGPTWLVVTAPSRIHIFGHGEEGLWRALLTSAPNSFGVETIDAVRDSPHQMDVLHFVVAGVSMELPFQLLYDCTTGERVQDLGSWVMA